MMVDLMFMIVKNLRLFLREGLKKTCFLIHILWIRGGGKYSGILGSYGGILGSYCGILDKYGGILCKYSGIMV